MNKLDGLRHRLNQIEEKVDFILKTVTVTITFNNPLDPNVGKSTVVALGVLFDEIKRVSLLPLEGVDGDQSVGEGSDGAEAETLNPQSSGAESAPTTPAEAPSGIIITG